MPTLLYERTSRQSSTPSWVPAAVDLVMSGFRLHGIRRYEGQRFWESETTRTRSALMFSDGGVLESVAEHSWHVADISMTLAPLFEPEVQSGKATMLAVAHDKLEMFIGDWSPIGPDGSGEQTHAFNSEARQAKREAEYLALEKYLQGLPEALREAQEAIHVELLEGDSVEARFVKAIDRIQALAYVYHEKGCVEGPHEEFTRRYSNQARAYFPKLSPLVESLQARLFD